MIILIHYSFLIPPLFLYNVQNSTCVLAKYITRSMGKLVLTMYTLLQDLLVTRSPEPCNPFQCNNCTLDALSKQLF
jgi:hypothetical protein